jgi:hypothetical protein
MSGAGSGRKATAASDPGGAGALPGKIHRDRRASLSPARRFGGRRGERGAARATGRYTRGTERASAEPPSNTQLESSGL